MTKAGLQAARCAAGYSKTSGGGGGALRRARELRVGVNPFPSTRANMQVRMLGACFELHRRLPTRFPTKLSSQRVC